MKLLAITLLVGLAWCPSQAEMRIWTSSAGSKIEAEFSRLSQGKVELKKRDGNTLTLDITQLSENDQTYVKETGRAKNVGKKEAPPLGESAGKGEVHRLIISGSSFWDVTGELEGTYELKDGSIEITIASGFIERTTSNPESEPLTTWILISVAKMKDKFFESVAFSEAKIVVNKSLKEGEKFWIEPQTLIIKSDSISAKNSEKQFIAAAIRNERDGRRDFCYLYSQYYYGTREEYPLSPNR